AADLIVAGPGSLYTSVIPNLLVRDIAAAVRASRALKAYVCNVATQPGETDHYSVLDHVKALEAHANGIFEIIVANDKHTGKLLPKLDWVKLDPPLNGGYRLVAADLIDDDRPWRHDSGKLAGALMKLLEAGLVAVRQ
ncbi:MAG TPA: 2-phospho-L-lactate transferase CofD family protein, partial [Anaerolineales bacterium]|nr:2-phospho-L-lactate transferase CofD family protein [Anaerolineales bacterium]